MDAGGAGGYYFYGNVFVPLDGPFYSSNGTLFNAGAYSTTGLHVYNNTFIRWDKTGSQNALIESNAGNGWSGDFRNNLMYSGGTFFSGVSPNPCDYNAFFDCGGTVGTQTQVGSGDPFVNWSGTNFNLKVNTTPGVALPSPYNVDMFGNTRTTWTRGAIEYVTAATNAVLSVTPTSRSFGSVVVGATSNVTFTVQNIGGGTLAGTASVAAPFSVVSGGSYSLGANQSQTTTVQFSPTTSGNFSQSVTFTGGGGATASVTGVGTTASTNLPPVVSVITQNASDVDPASPGMQVYEGTVVQYSGSASDPNGDPLTWQWIYTVNGGAEVVYQSGSGTVTPVSFSYGSGTAGNTYVWSLRASDGVATSQSALTVGVEALPPPLGTLTFQASAGTITAPFVVTNGAIYQSVSSGVTDGGRAAYTFTLTNSGSYVIQALVSASDLTGNSFYVNIDAEPQDPAMTWDINPMTSGFEQRLVSWRGNGTAEADQFVPQVFRLTAGAHQLIVRGREPNTLLQSLSILQLPTPPANLRVVAASP